MKSLKFIFILLLINFAAKSSFSQVDLSITEAIEDKKVKTELKVLENGTHYTIQFTMEIENLTYKDINVIIEPGIVYRAEEEDYQNFINTKEEVIALKSGQSKKIEIHAMCINKSKSAPNITQKYYIDKKAEGNLLELCQMINENNWYDKSESQDAIWCLTDDYDIENIIGPDENIISSLHKYISDFTDVPVPEPDELDSYTTNYYHSEFSRKVSGYFEYTISNPTEISIAMFNENNIIVRQLYYNENEQPGEHKFDYAFDATYYTDDLYYFKLLENGKVTLQMIYDVR